MASWANYSSLSTAAPRTLPPEGSISGLAPDPKGSSSGRSPISEGEELNQQQLLLQLQLHLFPLTPRGGRRPHRGLSQKQNFGRGSTSEPRSPRFRVHSRERTLGLSPKIFAANKTKPCEADP